MFPKYLLKKASLIKMRPLLSLAEGDQIKTCEFVLRIFLVFWSDPDTFLEKDLDPFKKKSDPDPG